jgi:hypothetical protein
MFRFWRQRLNVDDVPCPSNDDLRQMAIIAVTAGDPRRRLLDLLDDACKFSPPNWLIDDEFRAIIEVLEADRKAGRLDPIDAAKTKRQLMTEYREIAERRVRLGLVIAEIGRRNSIDPSLRGAAYENDVVDLIFGLAAAERA